MTRDRIDTKDGIEKLIGNGESLAGLTQLRQERSRWRKEHPDEPLNEWYVLGGRVFLDSYGQTWTAELEGDAHWVHDVKLEGRPGLRSTHSSKGVPRHIDSCRHCGGEINVRQLSHLFVGNFDAERDRLDVWHGECRILWIDEQLREAFGEAFKKAELRAPTFHSMPSHYTNTARTGPWYRVESSSTGSILIGWRKSVIYLGWEMNGTLANVDGRVLFKDENVTVGEKFVHAWGYDKLAEYLAKLASGRS